MALGGLQPLMSATASEPGVGTTLGASPVRVAVRVRPTDVGQTGNVVYADGHIGTAIRVQSEELGVSSGFDFDAAPKRRFPLPDPWRPSQKTLSLSEKKVPGRSARFGAPSGFDWVASCNHHHACFLPRRLSKAIGRRLAHELAARR